MTARVVHVVLLIDARELRTTVSPDAIPAICGAFDAHARAWGQEPSSMMCHMSMRHAVAARIRGGPVTEEITRRMLHAALWLGMHHYAEGALLRDGLQTMLATGDATFTACVADEAHKPDGTAWGFNVAHAVCDAREELHATPPSTVRTVDNREET